MTISLPPQLPSSCSSAYLTNPWLEELRKLPKAKHEQTELFGMRVMVADSCEDAKMSAFALAFETGQSVMFQEDENTLSVVDGKKLQEAVGGALKEEPCFRQELLYAKLNTVLDPRRWGFRP